MTKTKSRASASERTGEGSLRGAGGFRQTRVTRGDGIVILFTNLNYVDTFSHIKHFSISFLFLVLSISILFIIRLLDFFLFLWQVWLKQYYLTPVTRPGQSILVYGKCYVNNVNMRVF